MRFSFFMFQLQLLFPGRHDFFPAVFVFLRTIRRYEKATRALVSSHFICGVPQAMVYHTAFPPENSASSHLWDWLSSAYLFPLQRELRCNLKSEMKKTTGARGK